jgi:hypothetical protein
MLFKRNVLLRSCYKLKFKLDLLFKSRECSFKAVTMSQKMCVLNVKLIKNHSHSVFFLILILITDAQTVLLHNIRTVRSLTAVL